MSRNQRKVAKSRKRSPSSGCPSKPSLLDVSHLDKAPSPPFVVRIAFPVFVALCAFVTFLPALDAEFVNWDDDKVVTNNPHFRGFTSANLKWMFTQSKMGHYHPFTWLSYAIDHKLSKDGYESLSEKEKARYVSGLDPHIFHRTNVIIHAGVAVAFYFLACLILRLVLPPPTDRVDYATPIAATAAAILFACHPLRTETVAWITERRDVLSTLFLLPALLCYIRYAIQPTWRVKTAVYYGGAWLLLLASLLSKAWGITLPAVMLVLDVYPLRRIGGKAGWVSERSIKAYVDKIPFVILAAVFAIWAKQAQGDQLGTLKNWTEWTAADRLSQHFFGLFFYSAKTILPVSLTPLVPLPVDNNPFALRYIIAALVVIVAAIGIVLGRKRWSGGVVLAVCYAGILSPVLGLAQSGPQLVADRYSYVACLTWAILGGAGLLWVFRNKSRERGISKAIAISLAGAISICGVFSVLTWRQAGIWHNSRSLWTHAVKIDPECVMARTNLGLIERQAGNIDKAIEHYEAAIAVNPNDSILLNNLAVALRQDPARRGEVIEIMKKAVRLEPEHPDLHFALASELKEAGQIDRAISELQKCIQLKAGQPKYHRGLGTIYMDKRDYPAAREHYEKALALEMKLNPRGRGVINALDRLGRISIAQNRAQEGAGYFEKILEIDPDNRPAINALKSLRRGTR